jgi:hypothetical protein
MPRYLIHHHHEARECGAAFASFKGHDSPLRHRIALASCDAGGHGIWWCVDADDEGAALELLPHFVATRATAVRVGEVRIP